MEEMFHVPLIAAGDIKLLINGGNIEDNELVDIHQVGEGRHQDGPAAHAVARQTDTAQVQILDKLCQVTCHQWVGHLVNMGRVSVISRVQSQYSSAFTTEESYFSF